MEGIPTLGLFDCVFDVLLPVAGQKTLSSSNVGRRKGMSIWSVDYVDPLGMLVPRRAKMIVLEDNDAVIATVKKGRSTTLRHCSRTQRIALDWLLERLREDNSMTLRYVKTGNQNADFLTKAAFPHPNGLIFVSQMAFIPSSPQFHQIRGWPYLGIG